MEFDTKLAPLLSERFAEFPNFKLVMADALTTDFCAEILPARSARLVANLPYNISTAILQRLISQRACFEEMVLMLQREVVERLLAPAGTTDRGFISVLVEAYCEAEKLFDVAPGAFRPPPKVWSSVMRLKFRPQMDGGCAERRSIVGDGERRFCAEEKDDSQQSSPCFRSFAGCAEAQRRREHRVVQS